MIKKKTPRTPHYRHHRPSGQGVVTLNGKDFYLGKFNSPESKEQYDRMIAEWLLNNRHLDKKSVGFEQVGLRRSVSPPLFWNGVLSTHHLPASVAILACSARAASSLLRHAAAPRGIKFPISDKNKQTYGSNLVL